jgi:predicted RND superfamily exporter protein
LQPIDFSRIKTTLPAIAAETLDAEFDDDQVSVSHTGVSLLYHVAQEDLVADLYGNFLFAFLLIWPMMMLALRSLVQGTFAMIPNLCPAVGAYGLLGWLDYPIDLGMAMAACVALGIAVDDTTHFMLRFQELSSGTTVDGFSALKLTFLQCSRAMTHTSLVAGFGLAAFLFAPLAGMTRFAGLLIGLILIALLCDYVLLPALIVVFRLSHLRSGKAIE